MFMMVKPSKRRPWFRDPRKRRDRLTAFFFLLPSLCIFSVFVYYALGFNVYLSLTSWNFISPTKAYVGFRNFTDMWADPRFWNVVRNTTAYAVATVSLAAICGLGLALLLNQRVIGRGVFRTLIFSPYITTVAAISLVWVWIFDPTFGLFNYLLSLIGIAGPRWLTDTSWALPALIIMEVWRVSGYTMVIFLAGLTAIPREYYEAAAIDGANQWHCFWRITLPLLSPTTFFIIVTTLLTAFQVFDQVAVMTLGGPVDATKVFNFYIYEQAFITFRAGYAAAVSLVLFLLLLALTIVQVRLGKYWVEYQ